ncbi:MAG: amidohydrolase [Saprospiraceae bacterium]|nr:amidohydrolase [Saprospiraceae bacterium]
MRVSIVQSALLWEQKSKNLHHFSHLLAPLKGRTDLIVLPEMFNTGFSMNAAPLAEPMDGDTVTWMKQQANSLGAAITGSFICKEDGHYYNRLVFMRPDGHFDCYDKKHLFALAGENEPFTAGKKRILVEWMGWHIRPLICYDLRFPEWSRQQPEAHHDLLIYVANWPVRRAHHWKSLLTARAIENQCYTIGVNVIGQDGNGLEYSGDSTIVDYSGQTRVYLSQTEGVTTTFLNKDQQQDFRVQLPFLADMG